MFFLKNPILALILLCVLLLAGCSSSNKPQIHYFDSSQKADSESMLKRVAEFRQISESLHQCGVVIHPEQLTIDANANLDAHLEKVHNFGFNRVYYCLPDESYLNEQLKNYLKVAGHSKLTTELVIQQVDYFRIFRGGSLVRPLIPEHTNLLEIINKILEFNNELPASDRIGGITVIISPHSFTATSSRRPKDLVYAWSEKTYGLGLDNDMLMQHTFNELIEIAITTEGIPLTIGMPDFYDDLASLEKISIGRVDDFLAIAPGRTRVLLLNSGNKASDAIETIDRELKESRQSDRILVQLSLASHTSVKSGALRRRDWNDFIQNLQYLAGQWCPIPSFAGIVIDPFAFFELIYQEE